MPICENCGREFATESALAQHVKDKHASGTETTPAVETETRDRVRRKSPRRRNKHPIAIGMAVAAVVLVLGLYFALVPIFSSPPVICSTGESWIHMHPYLRISIEGTNVPLPIYIGYLPAGNPVPTCLEGMHTHDGSGIIHIELSQTDAASANFTLGDFFRVWNATFPTVNINGTSHNVTFSNSNILGFKSDATHRVIVLVDGKLVANGVKVPLEQLDYCDATNANVAPCSPTAGGAPLWDGTSNYPYRTGHTIQIEYVAG